MNIFKSPLWEKSFQVFKTANVKAVFLVCCVLFVVQSNAQQNVFSRSDAGTGDWGSGNLPWFYQTSNNNQGDPDNNNTVRNDVSIGHNNNTTMTLNGRYYIHRDFTFESGASVARTLNNTIGGGFSFNRLLSNASTSTHVFNTPVAIDANAAEVRLDNASGGGLTFNGSIFTNNNQTYVRFNNGNTGVISLTGAMTQGGSFVKQNGGTLVFSGSADFSGSIFIDEGTVRIGRNLSSNIIEIGGGIAGTTTLNAILELTSGTITVSKSITVKNFNSAGGSRTINFTNPTATTANISGSMALEKTVTIYNNITTANAVISGNITGAGGIIKTGAGILIINGTANSYTGLTTVSAGSVQLNKTGGTTIPATNNVTISGGSLQISSNQALNDIVLSSGATLLVDAGVTLTINGAFTGGGTIINNGKIVLAGPASFPGATTTITTMNDLEINRAGGVSLNKDLTIAGILTMTSGKLSIGATTLTLAGTVSGGSATNSLTGSSTSNLSITGTGALGTLYFDQTTDGTTNTINDIVVNRTSTGTFSLGNKLVLLNSYTPTNGVLTTGGFLTLRSTATKTARIAQGASGGGYITGNVTAERYIVNPGTGVAGRKWRLLSGKTTTTTQSIFSSWQESGAAQGSNPGYGTWVTAPGTPAGYDGSSNSGSVLRHDPITPAWVTPAATNTGALSDEQGYMLFVRGDRSADPSNTINNSTVLRTAGSLNQGTQLSISIPVALTGYKLVGNPYASPIDLENVFGTLNLSQFFQVWDASESGNFGVGKFRVVQKTGAGTYTATPATGNDNSLRYIHSGQAFFLKATGADATVVFNETHKTDMLSVVTTRPPGLVGDQQIYTELAAVSGASTATIIDAVRVWYNDANGAGNGDDLPKIGNFGENISSYRNGKKFIVEHRPMINGRDTIFLRSSNLVVNNYRFKINTFDFVQNNLPAFLIDSYLQTSTSLNLSGAVNNIDFAVTADAASASPDRFMIVFGASGPLPVTFTSIKAIQTAGPRGQNNNIAVEWKVSNEVNIQKYEVEKSTDGVNYSNVNTQTASGISGGDATYNWLDVHAAKGNNFYRIRSIGTGGDQKLSEVVKVTIISSITTGIAVYPNPVVNKTILMQFTNMDKGVYQVRLINASGQVLRAEAIKYAGGSSMQTMQLEKGVAPGNYRLEIVKPDNDRVVIALQVSN